MVVGLTGSRLLAYSQQRTQLPMMDLLVEVLNEDFMDR